MTPERHELRFLHDGYEPRTLDVGVAVPGEVVPIPEDVVLRARPGTVRGTVSLERFGDAALVQSIDVRLTPAEGEALDTVHPDARGAYTLRDVPAGHHVVAAELPGYAAAERQVEVRVGGAVRAEHMALAHESDTDAAVAFTGRVRLDHEIDHGGTLVEVRFAGRDRPFRSTVTDAAGRFEVPASRHDRYTFTCTHAGFAELNDAGPFEWQDPQARFGDEAGDPIEVTLGRGDFDGRIVVPVRFVDVWLPDEETWVAVRAIGGGAQAANEHVTADAPADLRPLPPGSYLVRLERPGFEPFEDFVEIGPGHVEHAYDEPIPVRVVDLAAAQLDFREAPLDGSRISDLLCATGLRGADLSGVALVGDFSSCDLSGANLSNADLSGTTSLRGTRLEGARLLGANLEGVDLREASLFSASAFGANLDGARLAGADLTFANLSQASLRGASFVDAGRDGVVCREGDLVRPCPPCTQGEGVERPGVRLDGALFNGSDLTGAQMAGVFMPEAALGGARMDSAVVAGACLPGAILNLADVSGAAFDGADLRGAHLVNAVLIGTTFRGADLTGASFTGAALERTDLGCVEQTPAGVCRCVEPFSAWDPGGACADPDAPGWHEGCACRTRLTGANLNGANLSGVDFVGADLKGATMVGAALGDALERPERQPRDCRLPEGCEWADLDACVPDLMPEIPRACRVTQTRFAQTRLDAAELGAIVLGHVDVTAASLRQAQMSGAAILGGATLAHADFSGADLSRAFLDDLEAPALLAEGASLASASLVGANLSGARLRGADLSRADVAEANLAFADLREADLRAASLSRTSLREADLREADLSGTRIELDGDWSGVNLGRANLVGATLLGPGLDEPVRLRGASLRRADLSDATVRGVRSEHVDLRETVWRGADVRAHFEGVTLARADFSRSLVGDPDAPVESEGGGGLCDDAGMPIQETARFVRANLTRVSFHRATLAAAFDRSDLRRADLRGARLRKTTLRLCLLAGSRCVQKSTNRRSESAGLTSRRAGTPSARKSRGLTRPTRAPRRGQPTAGHTHLYQHVRRRVEVRMMDTSSELGRSEDRPFVDTTFDHAGLELVSPEDIEGHFYMGYSRINRSNLHADRNSRWSGSPICSSTLELTDLTGAIGLRAAPTNCYDRVTFDETTRFDQTDHRESRFVVTDLTGVDISRTRPRRWTTAADLQVQTPRHQDCRSRRGRLLAARLR